MSDSKNRRRVRKTIEFCREELMENRLLHLRQPVEDNGNDRCGCRLGAHSVRAIQPVAGL